MRRFPIRSVMLLILVLAVGLSALKYADQSWAGLMLLMALVASGVGILGTIVLQGQERAWWIGFSVFASGYLALTFTPVISTEIGAKLPTTQLLTYVHSQVISDGAGRNAFRASLIQYQRTRRQLLASEDQAKGPSDPALDPIRTTLMTNWQNIRKNATLAKVASPSATIFDTNISLPSGTTWRSMLPGAANLEAFQQIGHALFAILAGLIGGTVAIGFHAKRERQEAWIFG
jgi:hypothetical protein